jgi:polysaccharide biosynthesis transport protein
MEQDVKTIGDFVEILKRRKVSLLVSAAIVFIVAAVAAFVWPPVYRSTSTILIEEQELPKDFVTTTVTSYADQRIQSINQRTMSTTKLLEIINRFNLYAEMKDRYTVEEIVDTMRKNIKFATISADVVDRRTAQPAAATIAFTVSYDGKRPEVVQQVANVLASLYLEENLRVRERQASGASKFLEEEARTVQTNLGKVEAKISAFKEKHINALPELLQVNLQALDRIERDIDQLKDQLRTLREKESYLQTQLATIPTENANQDRTLLKELKAKLVQLQSRVSDKYPDVIKTKVEIEELEKRLKSAPAEEDIMPGKRKVAASDQPDNPAYVTLASQLAGTQSDLESVQRQIQDGTRKREDYLHRIEASPRVDESFKALLVERNNTQLKYDDLMKKVMEARVAQGLEKEQMGERFTLIDPARLPEKPVRPNRPAVLLIGLVLAIGAGIGSASLREHTDTSVRSASQITAFTSIPVLATIPEIITWKDRQRSKKRRTTIAVGLVLVLAIGIVAFHLFIMDLDVFWARMMRQLRL